MSADYRNSCAGYQNIASVGSKLKIIQCVSHCGFALSKEVMCQVLLTTLSAQNIWMCKHFSLLQNNKSSWIQSVASFAWKNIPIKKRTRTRSSAEGLSRTASLTQWIPSVNWWKWHKTQTYPHLILQLCQGVNTDTSDSKGSISTPWVLIK